MTRAYCQLQRVLFFASLRAFCVVKDTVTSSVPFYEAPRCSEKIGAQTRLLHRESGL